MQTKFVSMLVRILDISLASCSFVSSITEWGLLFYVDSSDPCNDSRAGTRRYYNKRHGEVAELAATAERPCAAVSKGTTALVAGSRRAFYNASE